MERDTCGTSSPSPKSGTSGGLTERLHIAQPPLSQQIQRFEAELGEPLLYRTTRSVELAPAGEVLLERGREILALVDAALEDAAAAQPEASTDAWRSGSPGPPLTNAAHPRRCPA